MSPLVVSPTVRLLAGARTLMSSTATAWINAVLEVVRLSWQIQLALFITAVVVVVCPGSWAAAVGVSELVLTIRPYCFVLGLLMSVLLTINLVELLSRYLIDERRYMRVLRELSDDERELLRSYIEGNTKTQSLPISDGVAGGLVGIHVLYRASNVGHPGGVSFPFNIQPWAWTRLKRSPELLRTVSDGRSQ